MQTLADLGHELPARILEWRQLSKLKSTYADALVGEINPATGRVHTSYAMAATSTGRLSSNDPNLQNIPIRTEEGGRIRRAFVAAPGHVLVSADYSQIELRLLAHVARHPDAEGGVRHRAGHPCANGKRSVRRAGRGHGRSDQAPREGNQFRHHLRHQRLRPGAPARHRCRRGRQLHRRVFRALSRHPRLYGAHEGGGADPWLRHDAVRAAAAPFRESPTATRSAVQARSGRR